MFISDRSSQLQQEAAEQATLEADIRRLTEYSELVHRYQASLSDREALERHADAVEERIRAYGIKRVDAEGNVRALEQRCLEFLRAQRRSTSLILYWQVWSDCPSFPPSWSR
ncbi:hypothetical protein EV643_11610 [Kribbella sp. VKM Ac-2527]|uniref:Uncharacterized protein n=2 Tax=Kribbella caucasensis TaxID=2512215 RepID=A0A4R6K4N9_9ACTN|nr:hypothetical protein EV643_11610 [Kribbella sp. VKM Ac-2527]